MEKRGFGRRVVAVAVVGLAWLAVVAVPAPARNSNADDSDGDGVANAIDNCQLTFNPNQADQDADNVGNRCDSNFGEQDLVFGALYENRDCFLSELIQNDDSFVATSSFLPTPLNFLGNTYTSAFVNNNGNITFESGQSTFTPFEITADTPPIIAPFFADVDTRPPPDEDNVDFNDNNGRVWYGVALHAPRFGGRNVFCVTWEDVGYFTRGADKHNTFQLLLVERSDIAPGDFDIYFNYSQLEWETGDASGGAGGLGGTSAGAGYSSGTGDPAGFLSMPCSLDNGACLDTDFSTGLRNTSTNSLTKGRHIFEIRNGGTTFHGRIHGAVTMLGGTLPAVQALVELCPVLAGGALGRCRANTTTVDGYDFQNLPPGDYVVRAFPKRFGKTKAQTDPKKFAALAASLVGPYKVEDGDDVPVPLLGNPPPLDPLPVTVHIDPALGENEDRVVDLDSPGLGDAPAPGTTFGKTRGGSSLPHATSGKPTSLKVTLPCPGALDPTYEVLRDGLVIAQGSLVETVANNVSTYAASINIPTPGPVQIRYDIPGCATDQFDAYIDPSGFVVDQHGAPIAGAIVVLSRSDFPEGPFEFVPDGSTIMSPGNRVNPDDTDEDGHFGWDVVPGFYRVDAFADGCTSSHTDVLEIPPPVTDLEIVLQCGAGGGGGGSAPPPPDVIQISGPDRIGTAIASSKRTFPSGAAAVVLARADDFPDALVGTPLAVEQHAPLLLTNPSSLDPRTKVEIARVLGSTGAVHLLGGLDALGQAVADELESSGYTVTRYAGADRYATAVLVAEQGLGAPTAVLLATGADFADALTAGAAAAHEHAAVLLTDGAMQAAATAAYLDAHAVAHRFAVGGAAAAADPSAVPLVGADRYETSSKVAEHFFAGPRPVGLATGEAFPDALAGGAHIGAKDGPLLLTRSASLPSVIATYLGANKGSITTVFVYGGATAVVPTVVDDIEAALL
jgi:hypothetical protein